MNWEIKIISKTLMTKIARISWGVTTKAFTVNEFVKKIMTNWIKASWEDTFNYIKSYIFKNTLEFNWVL